MDKQALKFTLDLSDIAQKGVQADALAYLIVKDEKGQHLIFLKDIVYCASDNSYIVFYLDNGKEMVFSNFSMKKCEQLLWHSKQFHRVHSKYLVNMYKIACYKPDSGGGTIYMQNGEEVKVARQRKNNFSEAFYALSINTRLQKSS